jgi:hypothetical protein
VSIVWRVAVVAVGASLVGCWDFQPDPPAGPSALPSTRVVDVRIEYRQPQGCESTTPEHCTDLVWFFGSWMQIQQEVLPLARVSGTYVWAATAHGVPVNWPPADEPHLVRVFDPHLQGTETGGVTAARLVVGGQLIGAYDQPGTPQESGLIYIDDDGTGRNPQ